jgi:hypothetical protein
MVATATPDRKMPSSACIAQAKMGIRNCCAAFDVAASLPGLFTPSQSPPSGPSVRFEKFIQLLTSLFGEHQHPASACLIEDAPAVSHQHLVHHCGGGVIIFWGTGRSMPCTKVKILLASCCRVLRSAFGHNTFKHARTAPTRRRASSEAAVAS